MASSKDFLAYIIEQLSNVNNITYKKMMGEYIIYMGGRIAAYICDDRLLIKPTKTALKILSDCSLEAPYPGAKKMILVTEIDNKEFLTNLFNLIYEELELPKGR